MNLETNLITNDEFFESDLLEIFGFFSFLTEGINAVIFQKFNKK